LFRPFLGGALLCEDELFIALGQAPGGGARHRPEVRAAFDSGAIAIAFAPSPVDISSTLTRFACFVWDLPDNDLVSRGNAMIYSTHYPGPNDLIGSAIPTNLDNEILRLFDFGGNPERSALFYVYAVVSSSSYLQRFEGALYTSSDPSSPARVPIASKRNIRERITEIGYQIALLEKSVDDGGIDSSGRATWHDKALEGKLTTWKYDSEKLVLSLCSDTAIIVQIHDFGNEVFSLSICGHSVIEKWLRERTFPYLRRLFNATDLASLLDLHDRIIAQERLIDLVDPLVLEMLDSRELIPNPPLQN